jgi:Domain of unknown function (DUF4189)
MRNTDQGWRNRQMQFNIFGLRFAVIALAMAFQSPPCIADGALAVGLPADVAHVGFAAGHKLNAPDMDAARKGALDGCHTSINASEAAKKLCKVIATFRNQCYAIAIDPKNGTPGVGWSIAESLDKAKEQAIAQCRTTAGADRQQFCVILDARDQGCDGNAK